MPPANIVMIVAVLFLIVGLFAAIVGLTPAAQNRAPRLFAGGVTLAAIGFAMVVITWLLHGMGV
jgi:hypothetical protein